MSGTDPNTSVPETNTIEGVIVIEDWKARAEKVERERDEARSGDSMYAAVQVERRLRENAEAKIARIKALVERWRKKGRTNVALSWYARADELEAALTAEEEATE